MQDFYTKISLRQMRVSDLYANEALHVQNEKSKAAMLNRPDSYLNDAIDLRVILTETPVSSFRQLRGAAVPDYSISN